MFLQLRRRIACERVFVIRSSGLFVPALISVGRRPEGDSCLCVRINSIVHVDGLLLEAVEGEGWRKYGRECDSTQLLITSFI